MIVDVIAYWCRKLLSITFNSQQRRLKIALNKASTLTEYETIAKELDILLNNDVWKDNLITNQYDYRLIQDRLHHLKSARLSNDIVKMLSLLRAGMLRNFGGISNKSLYNRTYMGTKSLIEQYVNEVLLCLDWIDMIDDEQTKLDFFHDAKTTLGSTALCLHGGSLFGMCHVGVIKALFESGLLPDVIAGSGIGAVVGSLVGCMTDLELLEILPDLKGAMSEEGFTVTHDGSIISNGSILKATKNKKNPNPNPNSDANSNANPDANSNDKSFNKVENLANELDNRDTFLQKLTNNLEMDLDLDLEWLEDLRRGLSPSLKLLIAYILFKVGDMTFIEAHKRSGKSLNILIYPTNSKVPNLLNFLSTPFVTIRSAIACSLGSRTLESCGFTTNLSLFNDCNSPSLEIKFENKFDKFSEIECNFLSPYETKIGDASEVKPYYKRSDRSPYTRITEMFNVNHFLISVSRPYLAPFILWDWKVQNQPKMKSKSNNLIFPIPLIISFFQIGERISLFSGGILIREMKHRLRMFQRLGVNFGWIGGLLKWAVVDEKETLLETNHVPLVPMGNRWWMIDLVKIIEDSAFLNGINDNNSRELIDDSLSASSTRRSSHIVNESLMKEEDEEELSTMQYWIQCGERSVWGMQALLRTRCRIEFRLQEYFSKNK